MKNWKVGEVPTHVAGLELLQRVFDGQVERLLVVSDLVSGFVLAQCIRFVARGILGRDDLKTTI